MVYTFRLISNEEEDFIRDFEVHSDQTFYELHEAIQDNLHYDKSQIASFFICNEDWEKEQEITLFDLAEEGSIQILTMDNTRFSQFIKELKQKLLYVFDVFNERAFFVEVMDIKEAAPGVKYPVLKLAEGHPPQQILLDQIFFEGRQINTADEIEMDFLGESYDDGFFDESDPGPDLGDENFSDADEE